MGKRNKITTRDIAELTGVSQTTVSMILSGKSDVSFKEETVRLVKDTAKKHHYVKPKTTKKKSQKKVLLDTIAIFCPNVTNAYYSVLISSICQQAKKYHYHIFTITTLREASLEKEYLYYFKSVQPTGIIFLYPPASANVPLINELARSILIVEIGDKPDESTFDTIELNSIKSGKLIGQHLLQQGHRNIAYISSPMSDKEIGRNDRYEGLKKAALQFEDAVHIARYTSKLEDFMSYPLDNQEYTNGYDLCVQILQNDPHYTAFVGNNDMTAIGIMAALKDHGYSIGKDFAVCGFDNIPLAASDMISLTSVEHGSTEKGKEAVELIYNKKKQSSNLRKTIRMEYEPTLIIRKSSQKPVKA